VRWNKKAATGHKEKEQPKTTRAGAGTNNDGRHWRDEKNNGVVGLAPALGRRESLNYSLCCSHTFNKETTCYRLLPSCVLVRNIQEAV
jgi:hypothetical protein